MQELRTVLDAAGQGAVSRAVNGFKVALARRVVARALEALTEGN